MDRRRKSPSFSVGHILGDPFALATISLAVLAWLIALVGGIISQVSKSYLNLPSTVGQSYPNFIWWTTAYLLCLIVGVVAVVASASEEIYQGALVGFLGIGFIYSTSAVSALVYQPGHEEEAAAAGFILLSIIIAIWLFYFGSNKEASSRGYVDSFALHKEQRASMMGPGALGGSRPISNALTPGYPRAAAATPSQVPQMYTSNQLTGFENSSPVSGFPGGALGASRAMSPGPRSPGVNGGFGPPPSQPSAPLQQDPAGGAFGAGAPSGPEGTVEYPFRAKAVYSYDANPTDPNEISFQKHEILEVSDVSGRWWQAKKENGETGIAPSNYLILL